MYPADESLRLGRVGLGVRIRAVRESAQMGLAQVAEAAGISYSYLSDIERGRRSVTLEVLVAIAQALNVTVVGLLSNLYPWDDVPAPVSVDPPPDGRRRAHRGPPRREPHA